MLLFIMRSNRDRHGGKLPDDDWAEAAALWGETLLEIAKMDEVREDAAEPGIAEEEALKKGMEEKSHEFTGRAASFARRRKEHLRLKFFGLVVLPRQLCSSYLCAGEIARGFENQ